MLQCEWLSCILLSMYICKKYRWYFIVPWTLQCVLLSYIFKWMYICKSCSDHCLKKTIFLLILQVGDVTLVAREVKCYLYDFFTMLQMSVNSAELKKISDFCQCGLHFYINKYLKIYLFFIAMWIVMVNFDVSVYLQKCSDHCVMNFCIVNG